MIQLRAIVEANVDLLRHTADRRIQFTVNIAADLPLLYLNAGDLNQIVLNLLINARDTLDEKLGRTGQAQWTPAIALRAECLPGSTAEPRDAKLHKQPERWVRLGISDNGLGMSRAVLERIFEPFYTTKEVGRGTGLGLATVWHLLTDFGGRIEVDSVEGEGSTFWVYLPVTICPLPPAQPDRRNVITDTSSPRALRLLIAEDEEMIANVLQAFLKRDGHTALLCRNGQDAWDKFAAEPSAFDALLCDLNMPGLTGMELARRLRSDGHRCPLLVMSGRITEEARQELFDLGVDAIIDKPFTLEAVRSALARVKVCVATS
jgi:CheY-like chemotaxis protein